MSRTFEVPASDTSKPKRPRRGEVPGNSELIDRVAARTGIKKQVVNQVIRTAIDCLRELIVENPVGAFLAGLGHFRVTEQRWLAEPRYKIINTGKGGRIVRPVPGTGRQVIFRTTSALRQDIRSIFWKQDRQEYERRMMEKYGVKQVDRTRQVKEASADTCPWCGIALQREGELRFCPVHGSEPFEKQEDK